MLTFGSVFSGFGGLDLGFEWAGWTCKWQVEINEFCRRVLQKHWPDRPRFRNIKCFPPLGWDFARRSVDAIIGGDPCQANSAAAGPHRSRVESLGGEFLRVVDAIRPRIVLRENPSRTRKDAPWPWWRFRAGLESLGYAVLPFRLRACCLGADHQRERVFLLAEHANPDSKRLEGRDYEGECRVQPATIPPFLGPATWDDVRAMEGHRSRAGLPGYVERVTGYGNSVIPVAGKWIAENLIAAMSGSNTQEH